MNPPLPILAELNSRLSVAFHEIGHTAVVYWRAESLQDRMVYVVGRTPDRTRGRLCKPCFDRTEWDLMMVIAGPLVEHLAAGYIPQKPLRFSNEYRIPTSDSTRIRNMVRKLRNGKDDRRYNFEVQEKARAIVQKPEMWRAICALAPRLAEQCYLKGEECEQVFREFGAPTWLIEHRATPPAVAPFKARLWHGGDPVFRYVPRHG